MPIVHRAAIPCIIALVIATAGCGDRSGHLRASQADTLVVSAAASLSAPLRPVLDSFARATGTIVLEEHGASLELARRILDVHRVPDVIALADQEVFPELLVPAAASWYAAFARNRMVVAYTGRSRYAAEVSASNWPSIVLRPDVLLGRTDPELAPAGYRTLIMYGLAGRLFKDPTLPARLTAKSPPALLRGNAAELAALLSAGELDYIVEYESLARAQEFRYVVLPPELNLGDPSRANEYAQVSVRVPGRRDTVTRRGAPILYGLSIPRAAPHAGTAARFTQFLLGPEGRRLLARGNVDVLEQPVFAGDSVPAPVRAVSP